jgi:hypothetical protein
MLVEFVSVQVKGMMIFIDAESVVTIMDIPQSIGTACRVTYLDNQYADVVGSASDAAERVNEALSQSS